MRTMLPIVFGILLILFTTFDDNSVRYSTCENTTIVRYGVVENFSKNKKRQVMRCMEKQKEIGETEF